MKSTMIYHFFLLDRLNFKKRTMLNAITGGNVNCTTTFAYYLKVSNKVKLQPYDLEIPFPE